MYDVLYSAEALNIYYYLYPYLEKKIKIYYHKYQKEDYIKDLLYIFCMYCQIYSLDTVTNIKSFFGNLSSINDLDVRFYNDSKIVNYYNLYPLHFYLKDEKNKDICLQAFDDLKAKVINLNIEELSLFLEQKNKLDDLFQSAENNLISKEQLISFEDSIMEKINFLEKYFGNDLINLYKNYYNYKVGKNENNSLFFSLALKAQKNIIFKDLLQIKDLDYKYENSKGFKTKYLEDVTLTEDDKEIIKNSIKDKIIIEVLLFIVFLAITGVFFKFNLLFIIVGIVFVIYFLTLMVKKIKLKNGDFKNVKGIVGFIERFYYGNEVDRGKGKIPTRSPYYSVYLPKYNLSVNVEVSYINEKNKLQSKDMVLVCCIYKNKYIIPIKENKIIKEEQ